MSAAILDRPQGRSDEGSSSTLPQVRPVVPRPRQDRRPATRRAPVVAPSARSAVGCGAVVGGQPIESGYRMGRWARLTVTLSVLATALIVLFGGTSEPAVATVDVVTTSGQTVWSIARDAVGPSADPQVVGALADVIRVGNGLESVGTDQVLPIGLTVHVPVG